MLKLKFGNICNIKAFRARVELKDEDNFITEFLPILVSNSLGDDENTSIIIKTPVAILLDNNGDGVILGAIHTDENPPVEINNNKKYLYFSDGTKLEYDKENHILKADVKGEAYIKANKATIEGDLFVTGDVSDKKGSMQTIRDVYNSHTNPNGGVVQEKME